MTELFEKAIEGIIEQGYAVVDHFINPHLLKELNKELEYRKLNGSFNKAGIGSQNKLIDEGQRGDFISWIEAEEEGPAHTYWSLIEDFRNYLNQTCYLGLATSEVHFASYPAGAFYKKHLDAFQATNRRKISVITYLNPEWEEAYGGQLVIYKTDETKAILPLGGRMVCFESEKIPHEVLPSTCERRSLTGWLLRF